MEGGRKSIKSMVFMKSIKSMKLTMCIKSMKPMKQFNEGHEDENVLSPTFREGKGRQEGRKDGRRKEVHQINGIHEVHEVHQVNDVHQVNEADQAIQ